MTEFGEALRNDVETAFVRKLASDKKLRRIANRVRDGTYIDASDYSVRVGELMSEAFLENTETLSFMSKEVAEEVIPPVMSIGYENIREAARTVQETMNAADGVGLGVMVADLDTDRINGIVEKVGSFATFDDARETLKEPLVNFAQSVIDDTIRKNAKVSSKVGLKSYIIRKAEAGRTVTREQRVVSKKGKVYRYIRRYNEPCEWCQGLAGRYEYGKEPHDVYRRHEHCRCTVTFQRGNKQQSVWGPKSEWKEIEAEEQKKRVSKAQAAKELKAEKERRRMEYERVLRDDVGFSNVEENVLKLVDPDLLEANVDRLKYLESKFNVIHRSINPTFGYDGRRRYIAYVQRKLSNSADQNLYVCGRWYRDAKALIEQEIVAVNSGWAMPIDIENEYELKTYSITHEYGHMIHNYLYGRTLSQPNHTSFDHFVSLCRQDIIKIAKEQNPGVNVFDKISQYGTTNSCEFFAECFANSQGSAPNELGKAMLIWLERQGL